MSYLDDIIRWEQGELTCDEEIALFQKLIDSGDAWTLQGFYGRHAIRLIEAGLCRRAEAELSPKTER